MNYYVGIDLGGTNIAAGIVDSEYKIIGEATTKTNSKRPYDQIIDDMAKVARTAVEKAGITLDDVSWVGVGSPGTANQKTGLIEYSNNLDWHNVPLQEMLAERLSKKIYIDNDANAAAYGEYMAGSAKDVDISIMVTLGTGVGGGIVINNKVYTGFNFAGAELGHIVMEKDGRLCTCGRRGCLESYASATGLIITTKEFMEAYKDSKMWEICNGDSSQVSGRTAFQAAKLGDKAGQYAVDRYISDLACGVANIINIFQPDILSLGGGVSHEGAALLDPLREILAQEVYSRASKNNTQIVAATLGNSAGIIGAALLGLQEKA